jgi:surface protein
MRDRWQYYGGSSPVGRVLAKAGLKYLAADCTHMFYPNDPSRVSSNRHYLYINGQWVDPTTLDTSMGAMVGTLNADGTGGSLSYTPEIVAPTLVEGISILYTASNVVVPILSIGFNRALTAGERTALSGLIAPVAAAAGVSAAACSLITGYEFQSRCFKLKVNTALAGSASDTFVLPTSVAGTYAYTVDWGNGERAYVSSVGAQTKDYNSEGTRIVSVYGVMPRIYFNAGGDCAKVLDVQIGDTGWTSFNSAFYGCAAMVGLFGHANTANVTDMSYMFRGCTLFNPSSLTKITTPSVTNMSQMFRGCTKLNVSLAHFDTSHVTDMSSMLRICTVLKQSLAAWNVAAVANFADFLNSSNLNDTGTTTNYDATLIAWAAQALTNSLTFNGGTSKYSDAGEVARTAIATDDLWTFSDGGHI